MEKIAPYWKAVVGFIAPAAGFLIGAVTEASDGGATITASEWITALCTAIVTSAVVYSVPNRPAEPGTGEIG